VSAADLLADQEARVRAVDPTRSVILQAPAGSGKTTVLIERLLVLLCQAELPEEILAITFTRKAAAEMAVRVAQALNLDTPLARAVRARSQARGWGLEQNPNRLRIQTLDALNRALAMQMPLAARGSGALAVLPQPQGAYRNAARRTLLDAQTDAMLRPDVQVLFERMENDFARCETLIADMLAKRTHWLPYLIAGSEEQLATRVEESLLQVVQARLARAEQLLAGQHLQEGLSVGAAAARHLHLRAAPPGPWSELTLTDSAQGITPTLRQWQALAGQALTQEGAWRKRLDVRTGFPPEDAQLKRRATDWVAQLAAQPGALELLNEILILPDPQLSRDETQVLGVIARLLRLAVAELEVVFNELGRVDYPAIAAAARAALGRMEEPSELALRLDNRLRHILVDEFQDTSLEQTQLLSMLTAGWQLGDGRTLFLVGDPMQSIYGFREAEVGMFLSARTAGIGTVPLEALTLRRNFRSAPQVVHWNNAAFARCFAQLDDPRTSSVAFAPSLPVRAPAPAAGVHLHRVLPGDLAGEACSITRVITQLRAAEPESSIAVLVSARAHAAPIVAALEGASIAVAGVDLVPLAQLSIVRDLAALTRALDHLGDRTAWLAILRAPWCGLSLKEISQIIGAERRASIWERLSDPHAHERLEPGARVRLQRLQQTLSISLGETLQTYASGRESLARRVETAWLRLGGPAACRQESDLAHAQAFFAALSQWSEEPDWTSPQDLSERLGRLFAAHQAPHAQGRAVQIMTIHHAKGLEFDHVILPGLGRHRRGAERQLLKWLDLPRGTRGTDLLMVAVPPASASGPTPLGRYVAHLQEQRANNEATRLLYVAATRARLQLHLFGQLENSAPGSGTLLARLWPAIREQFPPAPQAPEDTALPQPSSVAPAAELLERLSARWHLPTLPPAPRPVMLPIAGYEALPINAGPDAALVERAVCEVLRGLARHQRLPGREPRPLEQALTRRLQRLGCAPAALPERIAAGVELLRACLDDARLQWIFASLGAADAEAEVPLALTGMFEGRLTSTRADLAFRDSSGTRWLIDIAPQPPGTLSMAFATRLARHVQLAQALDTAVPARAAIYLPATRCFWSGAVG
jgi:ATP-dependent helicase/nuclease subunit A